MSGRLGAMLLATDPLLDTSASHPAVPAAAAARLLSVHGDHIVFVPGVGWHLYNGEKWSVDQGDHQVLELALHSGHTHVQEYDVKDGAKQLTLGYLRETLTFAAGRVLASPDDFDGNPLVLGMPGGQVLDLWDRRRRKMTPGDKITRLTSVSVDLADDLMDDLLAQLLKAMFPDPELREYLRATIAYTLTGSVHEERMFVLFDAEDGRPQGQRGKSTLLDTLRQAMGDYAEAAPDSLLLYRKTSGIPIDVAALKGRRLAWANELPDSAPLDEARVKQLVSTGSLKARFMRENFFEFRPTHKLWVTTNTLPSVHDTGEGIWRRLTLLPVGSGLHDNPVCEPGGSKVDLAQLSPEPAFQAALLRWALSSVSTSIAELPASVKALTSRHRGLQDVYGTFISENLVVVSEPASPSGGAVTRRQVWELFKDWSQDDAARMRYRNQTKLYAAIRRVLPEGTAEADSGARNYYFPYLRVRV